MSIRFDNDVHRQNPPSFNRQKDSELLVIYSNGMLNLTQIRWDDYGRCLVRLHTLKYRGSEAFGHVVFEDLGPEVIFVFVDTWTLNASLSKITMNLPV
jgi:hypothetical protein